MTGPYVLNDDDEHVILSGTTCYISACFTDLNDYYRVPTKSCLTGMKRNYRSLLYITVTFVYML